MSWKATLAAEWEPGGSCSYPKLAVVKLNGVRGLVQQCLVARSLEPIPNHATREFFSHSALYGMDGELVVGDYRDAEVFVKTTSGVMTHAGDPGAVLWAFDHYDPWLGYIDRLKALQQRVAALPPELAVRVRIPAFQVVFSDADVEAMLQESLELGYEGLVLRELNGKYKEGRATPKSQELMRVVPWKTAEATIVGISEGQINTNESVVNALGYKKKSSAKAGKIPSGQAGSFSCVDIKTGIAFNLLIPTDDLQKSVWANKEDWLNQCIRYRFKPPVKPGGKPRFPQFDGKRNPLDMSD